MTLAALLGTTMLALPAFAHRSAVGFRFGRINLARLSRRSARNIAAATTAEPEGSSRRRRFTAPPCGRSQDVPLAIPPSIQERLAEAQRREHRGHHNLVPSRETSCATRPPTSLFPFIRGFVPVDRSGPPNADLLSSTASMSAP